MNGVPFAKKGDNSGTIFIHPNNINSSIQLPAIADSCKYHITPDN